MPTHLDEVQLVELLEGAADAAARKHQGECGHCTGRLDLLREGLELAAAADVPEPSPLYWEAFRRQVGRRIETTPASGWRLGLGPLLAAAAAVLVAIVVMRPERPSEPTPAPTLAAEWRLLPPPGQDEGLLVLAAFEPSSEELALAGVSCGLEACLEGLSAAESQALAALLREELAGEEL